MQTFFPYHGSKWRLAKEYGPPRHPTVIEPFAGSAGYSAYWDSPHTILVEKNPVIAGIWRWLIAATPNDIMDLPTEIETTDNLDIPQPAKDLIGMWFTRGSTGPRTVLAPANLAKKRRGDPAIWGEKIQLRLANQVERIKNWEIIEGDYTAAPDTAAHWHVDPPYQTMGKAYIYKKIDYPKLAEWCRTRQGTGEVCEGGQADWMAFQPLKTIINQRNNNYTELVYRLY